jgi:hypothetical protein
MKQKKGFDYFDKPENIRKLWIMLYVICGLLVIPDLFPHVMPDLFPHRYAHFGFDSFFGFYAFLGFVSCAALILFSKLVGLVLKAKEDYYDE